MIRLFLSLLSFLVLPALVFGEAYPMNANKTLVLKNQFGEQSQNYVLSNGIYFNNGTTFFSGAGAPTNGGSGTGHGYAGPGSVYVNTSNGNAYSNTNTAASPTWVLFGSAAVGNGTFSPTSEAITGAGALSTTKMLSTVSNVTSGSYAVTLAAPSSQDGQLKIIKAVATMTHTVTLAMTNIKTSGAYTATGSTTLTFTNAGDCAVFMAVGSLWIYLGGTAVAS